MRFQKIVHKLIKTKGWPNELDTNGHVRVKNNPAYIMFRLR